jgi:hypothetical protein
MPVSGVRRRAAFSQFQESLMADDMAPRRRVVIGLELGADSWDDAARVLEQVALQIRMGQMRGPGVSGGPATGYIYDASEDETVTHDSYFEALAVRNAAEDRIARAGSEVRHG